MEDEALLVLSTWPDAESARQAARTLVEEHLAACGNLIPAVESVYRWEGKVEASNEVLLLLKSTRGRYAALEARLKALHTYELPEIIALGIERGLAGYLNWVAEGCRPGK